MDATSTKGLRNMIKHPEITPCCATCEWSSMIEGDEEIVLCHKKKKQRQALGRCGKYVFDLLKYTPAKPKEVTTLDPTIIEI